MEREVICRMLCAEYVAQITKELSLLSNDHTDMGFRLAGSSGERKTALRIEQEMKRIGLQQVRRQEFPVHAWEFRRGLLTLQAGEPTQQWPLSSYSGAAGTGPDGITAELVDAGDGTARRYEELDVRGKIVLLSFDLEDYWLSFPAYEAKAKGAAACLISYTGDSYGTHPEALNSFDAQMDGDFPVAGISRQGAARIRQLLEKGSVQGHLSLDLDLSRSGTSCNVVGMIPGEKTDRYILLGAHLDGYFHACQDDLLGVGIILGIARAMVAAGGRPQHNIVFIAHGAEEYGVTGTRYDWCIGSWHSIHSLNPQWQTGCSVFLNIDAIRPGCPVYQVQATPEYEPFLAQHYRSKTIPAQCWPEGMRFGGLGGPGSDDYNYVIHGVPGLVCGRGDSPWNAYGYHTQFDDFRILNQEREIIDFVLTDYTELLLRFDSTILPPLDFSVVFELFLQRIADKRKQLPDQMPLPSPEKMETRARSIVQLSRKIAEAAAGVQETADADLEAARRLLHEIYGMVQGRFMKLTPQDRPSFPLQGLLENLIRMQAALAQLRQGDAPGCLEHLKRVDGLKIGMLFSRSTCERYLDGYRQDRTDLFWGTGRVYRQPDGRALLARLSREMDAGNSFDRSAAGLERLIEAEQALFSEALAETNDLLEALIHKMSRLQKLLAACCGTG